MCSGHVLRKVGKVLYSVMRDGWGDEDPLKPPIPSLQLATFSPQR